MRIEAKNLQEAFQKAASDLNCSVTQLDIKVIQHPSSGFLGFFKKSAIIEASVEKQSQKFEKRRDGHKKHDDERQKEPRTHQQDDKSERSGENSEKRERKNRNKKKKHHNEAKQSLSEKNEALAQNAFAESVENGENKLSPEYTIKRIDEPAKLKKHEPKNILDTSIIDNFNIPTVENSEESKKNEPKKERVSIDFDKILPQIKDGLRRLFAASPFDISKIEVAKFNDECVLIELDGEDAALLIGKEGYRYKAISYLLHNWLNAKYGLSIRLEIAEFLKNQEAMIDQYLLSVIERIETNGKAQTKPLDGVLVKIALEKLREKFPQKYVGIKSNGNEKFVVVNDFFKK